MGHFGKVRGTGREVVVVATPSPKSSKIYNARYQNKSISHQWQESWPSGGDDHLSPPSEHRRQVRFDTLKKISKICEYLPDTGDKPGRFTYRKNSSVIVEFEMPAPG